MSTPVYMSLNINISRHCTNCGMPNFSTSLFDSINMSTSNTFTSLNNSDICSQHSPGPPVSCSSPSNPKQAGSVPSNTKVIIINFRSIKNKRDEVNNIIDQSDPSVIIGKETWLNPSINSCEYFSTQLWSHQERWEGWVWRSLASSEKGLPYWPNWNYDRCRSSIC